MNEKGPSRGRVLWIGLAYEGSLLFFALLFDFWRDRPFDSYLNFRPRDFLQGLAGVIPLLILFRLTLVSSWEPLARMRRFLTKNFLPFFANATISDLFLISALAGIGEEFFFRGFLLDFLTPYASREGALLISSLLFGLAHMATPAYALVATFAGLLFGIMTLHAGNLMPAILSHALYDFIALVWLVKRGGGVKTKNAGSF